MIVWCYDYYSEHGIKKLKCNNSIIKILKKNNFIKPKLVLGLLISVLVLSTNINYFSKVAAETGIGKDVFKVVVSLFGITNSTKDIVTIVNVDNQTKVKVYNAKNPETEGLDKVSYTITFPNLNVEDGKPYKVCTVSVEDFKLKCNNGNNSPLNRPEFVDIHVSGKESSGENKSRQD